MKAETEALVALLKTGPLLGKVHVGRPASDILPPYVVVWPTSADDFEESDTGAEVSRDVSHIVHATALSPLDALEVADWVDERMRPGGWFAWPVVAGRTCDAIRRTAFPPLQFDDKERPGLWWQPQEYSFISRPGGAP